MTNKLPNSLELEINKFLEGFNIDPFVLTPEGVELAAKHYQKQKDEDKVSFKIKHHLAEAIRINNLGTKEATHATEFKSAPEIKRECFDPARVEKAKEKLKKEISEFYTIPTQQKFVDAFNKSENNYFIGLYTLLHRTGKNLLDALEETKKTGSDCNKVNASSQKINDFE
jgi:hypothetical protein